MESNFFSGSENLYKYLVSIGILMLVLTIYYPLKEKQDLEILKISLESELKVLNFEIRENSKSLNDLTKIIGQKDIDASQKRKIFSEISQKQKTNEIKQIKVDSKICEIENREKYVNLYNSLFWVFIISGIILIIFGFINWHKSKKVDDKKCKTETDLLELKLAQERHQFQQQQQQQQNTANPQSGNSTNQTTP